MKDKVSGNGWFPETLFLVRGWMRRILIGNDNELRYNELAVNRRGNYKILRRLRCIGPTQVRINTV